MKFFCPRDEPILHFILFSIPEDNKQSVNWAPMLHTKPFHDMLYAWWKLLASNLLNLLHVTLATLSPPLLLQLKIEKHTNMVHIINLKVLVTKEYYRGRVTQISWHHNSQTSIWKSELYFIIILNCSSHLISSRGRVINMFCK